MTDRQRLRMALVTDRVGRTRMKDKDLATLKAFGSLSFFSFSPL